MFFQCLKLLFLRAFGNPFPFQIIIMKNIVRQYLTTTLIVLIAGMVNAAWSQHPTRPDSAITLSPLDFGLEEAATDSARYVVLYNTHLKAVAMGADVSYRGIDTLTIEVKEGSLPIPLTRHNDFSGLRLTVKNTTKPHYLFSMADTLWQGVDITPSMADSGSFAGVEMLAEGTHMVVLEDLHPWVDNRAGYKYGAMRKDILLVRNGKALNRPVAPYSTDSTLLSSKTHPTDESTKTIANISIIRDTSSTSKTYCFDIKGINHLIISKVTIRTPDTKNLYADAAINIENCTNITLEDVLIDGTYSRTSNYGYGIQMNNVWNSNFIRLTARANWGVFGTNNLSNTTLRNCNINRFDIHCYGRDAFIYNCKFSKLYNQFSSLYGTLLFEGCRFTDFIPVLIETSYNAYTGFNLIFKDCTFDATPMRNYLVSVGNVDNRRNARPELREKCWPNVSIQNMTVNISDKISKVILFYPKGQATKGVSVNYISTVQVNGLRYVYSDTSQLADFVISNTDVTSSRAINYDLDNITLIPSLERMKRQADKKYSYPGSLAIRLRHNRTDIINITGSRLNYNVNENSQYNIKYDNCHIGMIRYNSNNNGTKRNYNRCTLYLNNADDARYYIDNQAVYYKCTFVPCSDRMFISFYGTSNDVVIKNCKSTRKTKLFYQGRKDNIELKGFVVKGSEKYWK